MTHHTASRNAERLRERLEAVGQAHLLNFYDGLDPQQQDSLLGQIAALDIEALPKLVADYVERKPAFDAAEHDIKPPTSIAHDDPSWDRDRYRSEGETLLAEGKVAALVVAGGQGSRLGYDGPKGCYPGGAVTGKPLFRCLAEWILHARQRFGKPVPWYIMTSPLNDQQTRDFFREHDFFGLPQADVTFFTQGTMPAFDINTGKVLLAAKDTVATSPDGHGGTIKALLKSGALDDLASRGIEHLSYVQIDNPLARVIDPVFLGLHAKAQGSSAEMSSKAIAKTEPDEKVGVLCSVDGRTGVIEYSDLPADLAARRDESGRLTLRAGSTAIHLIGRRFLETLTASGEVDLPFHRAEKNMACIDPDSGLPADTEDKNAVKLEMFIFDALPKAEGSIVYEIDRVDEFAPIKNAEGKDSPATSARLQTERAARWLESRGVSVPRTPEGEPDCTLEVSPLTATGPDQLSPGAIPDAIKPGDSLAL